MREAFTIGIREVVHRRVDDELLDRDALPLCLVGQGLPAELVELDLNPGSHIGHPRPSRITVRTSLCLIARGPPGDRGRRAAPDIPRRRSDTDHTLEARWSWGRHVSVETSVADCPFCASRCALRTIPSAPISENRARREESVGARCKIQSHTFICEGVEIHDEVFVGHGVMFVNDKQPCATNVSGDLQHGGDWQPPRTVVAQGACVGSGAVVLGGVHVGAGAVVGACAVVTRDVPPRANVVGVPARFVAGHRWSAAKPHVA
jgi:UDP-2-acetamido-3-amino-2,3-dideoxy-glucuronate N-acetyltransferase